MWSWKTLLWLAYCPVILDTSLQNSSLRMSLTLAFLLLWMFSHLFCEARGAASQARSVLRKNMWVTNTSEESLTSNPFCLEPCLSRLPRSLKPGAYQSRGYRRSQETMLMRNISCIWNPEKPSNFQFCEVLGNFKFTWDHSFVLCFCSHVGLLDHFSQDTGKAKL